MIFKMISFHPVWPRSWFLMEPGLLGKMAVSKSGRENTLEELEHLLVPESDNGQRKKKKKIKNRNDEGHVNRTIQQQNNK